MWFIGGIIVGLIMLAILGLVVFVGRMNGEEELDDFEGMEDDYDVEIDEVVYPESEKVDGC